MTEAWRPLTDFLTHEDNFRGEIQRADGAWTRIQEGSAIDWPVAQIRHAIADTGHVCDDECGPDVAALHKALSSRLQADGITLECLRDAVTKPGRPLQIYARLCHRTLKCGH
jgi:hypothetical protein